MLATGIIRRIDELGRVVIPKEIRSKMHIGEGEPLEIFLNGDEIFLRKYQPEDQLLGAIESLERFIKSEELINTEMKTRLATLIEHMKMVVAQNEHKEEYTHG